VEFVFFFLKEIQLLPLKYRRNMKRERKNRKGEREKEEKVETA